jgi:bifunctional non-homologous end joining protein LigD
MADKLRSYRRKRDFSSTPEPAEPGAPAAPDLPRFVVHEHHARRLHWDLRLERDGVLVSWAVPKGIPQDPSRNHLAVHVEDHPLSYIDFQGEIPRGQYGAGQVMIWDQGTYAAEKFRDDEVIAVFYGERLRGRYALFQTGGDDWMIHRMDPPADPGREPIPEGLRPMLARPGDLPRDDADHAYEIKWDGVRALGAVEGGRLRLSNRNGRDVTGRYPELRPLGRELASVPALLDGEVVAFRDDGTPSFELLQRRMHVDSESAVRRLAAQVPVTYVLFDLLHLDGRSTMALPYTERRELLEGLELEGAHWCTPAYHAGDGKAMLAASGERGLEGVIAKRLDSPYEPGRRSACWIKVKNVRSEPLVVGGWLPGEGGRRGRVGALLVGYHDASEDGPGPLRYAGRVGSGLSEATLSRLGDLLAKLASDESPFTGRQPPRGARWVRPRLVAAVEFSDWTRTKTLRHPRFKGLVDDLAPEDVVLEAE